MCPNWRLPSPLVNSINWGAWESGWHWGKTIWLHQKRLSHSCTTANWGTIRVAKCVCCAVCVCSWSDYLTKKQSVQHSNQGASRTKKRTFFESVRKEREALVEGWLEGVGDAEELSVGVLKHAGVCLFIYNLQGRYSYNKSGPCKVK